MTPEQVIGLVREALWLMIRIGGPMMLTALVVGLVVSLVQALTQIQEMTLSFVPKVVAMSVALILTLPFMFGELRAFTEQLFDRIITVGTN
ncbi:MAG TPA: flagellar biosynthesis protein FliQ [Geminicoccus sp.]|jgi:flagellar biosynthetic protein FliQ|uniref:flagellar biosynthesis protein FliQ n=1 Tax=Geminicoccus sp. TaxID=2024832 RepID=UPI002E341A16|nr:flagellar biosynthesis protein FliQ [Geminicoccus sp.]HEX2529527.1 flagellar biosynthesis protein FliQ [Geminicoccus sp.]